jgi:PIN domain nuclease of toxin-antitoxin system
LRLLLDSNVLLWSFGDRKQLTPRVRRLIEDDENDLFVSRACIWELSLKVAIGRLQLPGSTIRSLINQIEIAGLTILELEDRYFLRTETLPHHHGDPFDRLLVAQAMEENLVILTSDKKIALYDVKVIWR